ncbi:MAG: hypothetical protein HYW01_04070 [Deltaproteobacteria bacterium]|nr:hypothetical protein [Deltaproteobacteria bacterium]
MKVFMKGFGLISLVLILNGCAGGQHGAGYWFHFIFIIIPLIVIGYLLLNRGENISNSLDTIEGQLKKLSAKVDSLEEKITKQKDKKEE